MTSDSRHSARRGPRRRRPAAVLAAVVLALMMLAPMNASAADSSVQGYGGSGGQVQAQVQANSQDPGTGGSLPFTGLDLGLLVAGGAAMVLVGGGVRRLARHAP